MKLDIFRSLRCVCLYILFACLFILHIFFIGDCYSLTPIEPLLFPDPDFSVGFILLICLISAFLLHFLDIVVKHLQEEKHD